jgi:hypothetical protein
MSSRRYGYNKIWNEEMLPLAHWMQIVILYDNHTNQLVGFYDGEAESSLQVQECLD